MTYALPKELSYQLKISEKTVYNYINKYKDKIRTRKDLWKTFVHSEDFTKVLQNIYSMRSNPFQDGAHIDVKNDDWNSSEAVPDYQISEFEYLQSKNENLEKQNNNLTDQLNKYAVLLREEKSEKQEILSKYDNLNKQHVTKVEEFGLKYTLQQSKYGRLLAFTWVSITIACAMVLLYLITSGVF